MIVHPRHHQRSTTTYSSEIDYNLSRATPETYVYKVKPLSARLCPEETAYYLAQMWLIDTSTFQLREFTASTPPYATFSHVTDENEASFEDLAQPQRGSWKEGIEILGRACGQARTAGLEWLWNHAACVDRRSSAAQSEAINSLAQIYRGSEYSIVYLKDLEYKLSGDKNFGELAECRWIKNIWAIPQAIFPREICFFSSDWIQIGTKRSLLPHLSSIIGIDKAVLEDSACLEDYSIARRMSWASDISVSRIEDSAYALLGLFDISMPVVYGEGRKSFLKLQEEIMRDTNDLSLLAWDGLDDQEYNGLFAHSPACFRRFRNGPTTPLFANAEVQIHCAGITMQTSFWKTGNGLFLPLEGRDGSTCCIRLSQWNGCFVRKGSQVKWNLSAPIVPENRTVCVKRDVSARLSEKISAYGGVTRNGSCEALDEIGTARATRCSTMDYNSNDETGSITPSVDNSGMTSRYATSESLSQVTSQEDPIAWSSHESGSLKATMRAFDNDLRPSWVGKTTSEPHCSPEGCSADVAGKAGCHSPCSDFGGKDVGFGSQKSMRPDGSPPTEAQVLDVAQAAMELEGIAVDQFLSGGQRQSNKRSLIPWQDQNRKRPRLMHSPDQIEIIHTSDSGDGDTVLVRKARDFACPFYVGNNKYTECVTRHHLQSIEEVKEHVCWEHRRPMFCPVCKEEFRSGRDRDAHIRLRICHANTSTTPDGITDDQEERLNREENPSLPEDMRWFQIWDMIFPDVDRPSSTLYTGEREVSVCSFRQFWMQSGEEIVAAFLEKRECQSYNIQNEERELRAIYDLVMVKVVDRIFVDISDFTGKD